MKKKIMTVAILACLTISYTTPIVYAQHNTQEANIQEVAFSQAPKLLTKKTEKELKTAISKVYGSEQTEEIYTRLLELAKKARNNRPQELIEQDKTRTSDWYKDEIIYMYYADRFGVSTPDKPNQFKDTEKMLDYLQDLGVTTLYILPFADSPMGDAGFDVKNPDNVRKDLGGMAQFEEFAKVAKSKGFKIKADLVYNHFSDKHEWFQQALNGDLDKINYFVVKENMPSYTKYNDEKKGVIVEYQEENGKISKRRLIFPQLTENHYRKVTIQDKDYYFYHTFYPFQLDINWMNPEVLYYCLETLSNWANRGIDIFRLDAVPYFIKEDGTDAENHPQTHQILKILSIYLQITAPSSVIIAEACQTPKDILPYFGNERKTTTVYEDTELNYKRTDQFQLAYHFPYMPALWATLVTSDNKHFIEANKTTPQIPSTATWAIFLRLHDELTLEMIAPETREILYNSLVRKGVGFREGLGVSGRMADFLDYNPQRISMAFSLLLSLPGVPVIYYGDEVGAKNDLNFAKDFAEQREYIQKKNKIKLLSYFDSRDIHRGIIPSKLFYGSQKNWYKQNSKIYNNVKEMIDSRKENPAISRGNLNILKTKRQEVFAYTRTLKNDKILVINNLSNEKIIAEVDFPVNTIIKQGAKSLKFKNLLNNRDYKAEISITNRKIFIPLQPYEFLWLKAENEVL